MRAAWLLMVGALGVGCKGEPPCVDDEGEEVPFCEVEFSDLPEPLLYCPGDHWGAEDGCNSCGCDADGNVTCTTVTCE